MSMFCYQCEQTTDGVGCVNIGVCGKDERTAALQDLLVHACKGIGQYAHRAAELGQQDRDIDVFVVEALFSTVTNVDFDPERQQQHLIKAGQVIQQAKALYEQACAAAGKTPESLDGPATWQPADGLDALVDQGGTVGIAQRKEQLGDDYVGLQELIIYGLKGTVAYADHALILGQEDPQVFATMHAAMDFVTRDDATTDELLGWSLKIGEMNLRVMQLLDEANTGRYGHPEPTEARITPVAGKCILVSGHDLADLERLLVQTEGKGVNVYTHGEMLPCLAYPGLKKFKHLVGNYGGAWQNQRREFAAFPGSILMTTNCIQRPNDTYMGRIFTTGVVAWPGVAHIGADKDFAPVIEAALAEPGFAEDAEPQTVTIGFGHNTVMSVADKVIEAVKGGQVKHFFLIGGCDGTETDRNYFTDFASQVPDDCIVLTLGCGKYRFNKQQFGDIGGIPRLLDMGQCNDAYSAIQVAVALAGAFDCGVNDLPLSMVVSWFEQKAVAVLLTLLHLGIKNIRLGPNLPAFVTPPVLNVLVETFDLKPIGEPQEDLQACLA